MIVMRRIGLYADATDAAAWCRSKALVHQLHGCSHLVHRTIHHCLRYALVTRRQEQFWLIELAQLHSTNRADIEVEAIGAIVAVEEGVDATKLIKLHDE